MNAKGIWFSDETSRRIKLRSAATLVGKEPTKQKRIKMMVTMYLDKGGEDQISGLPDWLEAARDFVMRNGEMVTAAHVVKECNVTMGDANLFKKTPTEAPKTQLDHFQVKQMGKSDDPDTVVTFEMRTQFSTDLWGWCGQQSGEEFDVTFAIAGVAIAEAGALALESQGVAADDEGDEDDASEEEDYETARAEACSPKHDAEFGISAKAREATAVANAKKKLAVM